MQEKYLKYQKYLPSKKFIIIITAILVLVIVIYLVFFSFSGNESFFSRQTKGNTVLKIENQTLNDLMKQDSDNDGVLDWEEALWGTDKNKVETFDNTPDATYIANKKNLLNIEESVNEEKLTETEKFAREFFTSLSTMRASGGVDGDTINGFSNALGQKIVNPTLVDIYTEINVKIDESVDGNDIIKKLDYYETVQKLFKTYQSSGIGDELDIINNGLASIGGGTNIDPSNKLAPIANAYQNFAKKIMELDVPSDFILYHLQIANASHNTGISIINMKEIINDPLVGLTGISQYQKYSADLVKIVEDLQTELIQ